MVGHIAAFNFLLLLEFASANLGYEAAEGFIKSRLDLGVVFPLVTPRVEIDGIGMIRVKDYDDAVLESAQNSWK